MRSDSGDPSAEATGQKKMVNQCRWATVYDAGTPLTQRLVSADSEPAYRFYGITKQTSGSGWLVHRLAHLISFPPQ